MRIRSLALFFCLAACLYADVMYEMTTTTTGMAGMADNESTMRIFIKKDCSRTEVTAKSEAIGTLSNTYIIRLDKKVIWMFDDVNKKYTEIAIGTTADSEFSSFDSSAPKPAINVETTDERKIIMEQECKKIAVSMKLNNPGSNVNFLQELWVVDSFPGVDEIKTFNKKLIEIGGGMMQTEEIGVDSRQLKQFVTEINNIEGFPLEIEFDVSIDVEEMKMEMKTKSTVTKISVVPISDKVFEIPEGYTLQD